MERGLVTLISRYGKHKTPSWHSSLPALSGCIVWVQVDKDSADGVKQYLLCLGGSYVLLFVFFYFYFIFLAYWVQTASMRVPSTGETGDVHTTCGVNRFDVIRPSSL